MFRVIAPLGLLLVGCQASANAQVSAAGPQDVSADARANIREDGRVGNDDGRTEQPRASARDPSRPNDDEDLTRPTPQALFGARAGLHLATAMPATCQCLAVVVGQPDDARFAWDGQPSVIDPATQLAVALGSDGLACPAAPADTLGASYHGYTTDGRDVVISVEVGRLGRPVTRGAILPKPPEGGRIVVRPVNARTPYGRALNGDSSPCIVPFAGTPPSTKSAP